jgi:uncharacterized protein (TIGR02145 family)
MKTISRKIACLAVAATASVTTASAAPTIIPVDAPYTITEAKLVHAVPIENSCQDSIYRWWCNGVYTKIITRELTIPASSLTVGQTYWYQRTTRCGSCGMQYVSDNVEIQAKVISSDATLKTLTVNTGTLAPTFAPDSISYMVGLASSVTSITVTGTANHSEATVSGNVTNKTLAMGSNTVTLTVTAEDGTTQKIYTITVVRGGIANGAGVTGCNGDFYRTKIYDGVEWMIDNSRELCNHNCTTNPPGYPNPPPYAPIPNPDHDSYGYYYSWVCISANQACPDGWILPNDADFTTLNAVLTTGSGWADWNSYFSLAGMGSQGNYYDSQGVVGLWWSSSSEDRRWHVNGGDTSSDLNWIGSVASLSVRCRKP